MDKSKTTKNNSSKLNNGDKTTVKDPVKYEQSVYLKHRSNSSVEFKFNGKLHKFGAHERKKFDASVLESKDFKKSSKYFTVEKGE